MRGCMVLGFRYHKSINLGGGFRINLSKSGIGYSWGTKGYRVTHTANGRTRRTTSIPGTGISYVQDNGKSKKHPIANHRVPRSITPEQTNTDLHEIESADVSNFQSIEYEKLLKNLSQKQKVKNVTNIFFAVSFLFIWSPPVWLALLLATIVFKIVKGKRINLEYTLDKESQQEYDSMRNAWEHLFQSKKVWQVVSFGYVSDSKRNAGVGRNINRAVLFLRKNAIYPIRSNIPVLSISLRRQKLWLLPDHLLVMQKSKFGILDYKFLNLSCEPTDFVEDGVLPKDAEVVRYTWQYVNKDGSPDKRYANNRKYAVCKYGDIHITSQNGLNIELQCSNYENAVRFCEFLKPEKPQEVIEKDIATDQSQEAFAKEITASEDWKIVEDYLKLNYDPNICDAVRAVVDGQTVSISSLQHKLNIGYARVGRIIDIFEGCGIITPSSGSAPRTVLVQNYVLAINQIAKTVIANQESAIDYKDKDSAILSTPSNKIEVKEKQNTTDISILLEQLNKMVGLEPVKEEILSMVNLIKVRKMREANHLPNSPMSLHMVFTGNPGTGKTTVARLLSQIYKSLGVLSGGQMIEVDRSGLVAGYVGQTAIKTSEIMQKALGGILFIDEAYSLTNKGENDFGNEAIETILKYMEDNRNNLVVIVAGYRDLMSNFINSNPGLKSRFNKYLDFEDYTPSQLYRIFLSLCTDGGYELTDPAAEYLKNYFSDLYAHRDQNFANARDVRNSFETILTNQANRISQQIMPSVKELKTIQLDDVNLLVS